MKRLIPPVLLIFSLLLIAFVHIAFPIAVLFVWPINLSGGVLIIIGLGLAKTGAQTFKTADTNIHTFKDPGTLVTGGLFAHSRNPMYLGFALTAFGAAGLAGTLAPVIVAMVFFIVLDRWYVQYEEKKMIEKFGEAYQVYCKQVRRWI